MRKHLRRLLALLLVCLMILPLLPTASAKIIIEDEPDPIPDLDFEIIDIKPSKPSAPSAPFDPLPYITGPLKMLATRAWQELSAYSIANDVPGFSTFFKLMQTPAERAALQQKEMITTVVADIADIKATVKQIESQLQDVSDKLDLYATAGAFNEAAKSYKAITEKYGPACDL